VKGAFTGADQNKIGLAEAANGGDLFLDEIEAMPLTQQVKLLRFLETGEVRKVGAKEAVNVKTRVIVATNQKLEDLVQKNLFREDLLWRISGKKIVIPPLRERKEDIIELAEFFLAQEKPRRNKTLTPEAVTALSNYSWPGNIRELKRVTEQVSLMSPLPFIRGNDVTHLLREEANQGLLNGGQFDFTKGLAALTAEFEAIVLRAANQHFKDAEDAAQILQISKSTYYKKLKDYGIGG
jgi:DNA-binding NtrC family response regulator